MCITFFLINTPTQYSNLPYKFILTFNREEQISRLTTPLSYWHDNDPNILAGRDEKAGGTWLGINVKTGNIAILTNAHVNEKLTLSQFLTKCKSRGDITNRYLRTDFYQMSMEKFDENVVEKHTHDYIEKLLLNKADYGGYNAILGNIYTTQYYYFSNRLEKDIIEQLKPGLHSLSNTLMSENMPKMSYGLKCFESILSTMGIKEFEKELLEEDLLKIMSDTTKFDILYYEKEFPNIHILKKNDFQSESSIFVEQYITMEKTIKGTKSTSILFVDMNNKFEFMEINHDLDKKKITRISGQIGSTNIEEIKIIQSNI